MAALTQFPPADGRTLPSSPDVSARGSPATSTKVHAVPVPGEPSGDLGLLKEKLLMMASYAETAVNRAVKALARRDDDLASRTSEEDDRIDRLEVEVDDLALQLLATRPGPRELRFVTMAMKIANNLERVGDEATTISRRVLELSREPQLQQAAEIPPMAATVLRMLKDSLDSFVRQDPGQPRAVIPPAGA